jgi:hypothetical protein
MARDVKNENAEKKIWMKEIREEGRTLKMKGFIQSIRFERKGEVPRHLIMR